MVVKSIIDDMLPNIWPLVLFISVVAITLRCAYLFRGSKKFVLHKELLSLVFIIYILCLYYVLTYQDINYGTIIKVKNDKTIYYKKDEIEIKIIIHTDTPLLYKIDYFDIKKDYKNKIYYYKNNFYLELENKINKDKYLKLLEVSEVIYEDTHQIINNGLKIKV